MTLNEARVLLCAKNITFELCEFENEIAYWHHISLFPNTQKAKLCKVIALIIKSNNQKKNIELQFNAANNDFIFEELRFGSFLFEYISQTQEGLPETLIEYIEEIQTGNYAIVIANDLKRKKLLWQACYGPNDDDDALLGRQGYENALRVIAEKKSLIGRLFHNEIQYEIYDWNTYQCIVK